MLLGYQVNGKKTSSKFVAPPLLVNSDPCTRFANQALTEFTRRWGWGVRSLQCKLVSSATSCLFYCSSHRLHVQRIAPHPPAPSPHKFGHRLKLVAKLFPPNLRGEGEQGSFLGLHSPFLSLILLALFLTGCISKQENEVVVLSALDREFSEVILDDVSAELNIPIRKKFDFESNKTVGLANEIIQNQKRPRADLFWNNEILHTIRLERLGLLEQYASPQASRFPASFRSDSNSWFGLAARCRVLIVNTDLLPDPAERPTSIMDLAEPQYAGKCTLARPLFGTSATHAAVLFDRMGKEKATDVFARIASNCRIQGGNKQVAQKVAAGEFLFGLTDTDDAVIEMEKGRPVAIVFPDQSPDQDGALLIPNTLCLIKNGPNPVAAREVLDRLLQADVEQRLSRSRSAQIPLAKDVLEESRLTDVDKLKVMEVDFGAAATAWPEAVGVLVELFPVGG